MKHLDKHQNKHYFRGKATWATYKGVILLLLLFVPDSLILFLIVLVPEVLEAKAVIDKADRTSMLESQLYKATHNSWSWTYTEVYSLVLLN